MTRDAATDTRRRNCRRCGAQLEQPASIAAGLCLGCRLHREAESRDR